MPEQNYHFILNVRKINMMIISFFDKSDFEIATPSNVYNDKL